MTMKKSGKVDCSWQIGSLYLICTVTFFYVGRLIGVDEHELTIVDASRVYDTGRFAEALKTGKLSEVEPYPDGPVKIGRGAIVDASIWSGEAQRIVL